MLEFFLGGGYSMFLVLVFGLLTLAAGVGFSLRPGEQGIALVRALSAATTFAVLSGVAADLAAVGNKIPANPEWSKSPDLHLLVMMGISESLAPAILGFTLASLAWVGVAVGVYRLGKSANA